MRTCTRSRLVKAADSIGFPVLIALLLMAVYCFD